MEPPAKVQALEIPGGESDSDYEAVPQKSRKKSPLKPTAAPNLPPVFIEEPVVSQEPAIAATAPNATDDDWLRSRTNRLLDLMDPEDIVDGRPEAFTSQNIEQVAETRASADLPVDPNDKNIEETVEEVEDDIPDATLQAISANGRLFVRNLPYSASEEDLRKHLEPFGSLEEVCISPFLLCIPSIS